MFERIPKELKENALFCLYKLEQRKCQQTKVPYQVRGARADPSNPKCFVDFNTVERAYEKGGYAGLGVGVFEPYVMIDIDHCVTNGELSDMAKKIVGIMDSYTEYSPSGTGVHIIAKVDNFKFDASTYYINNRKLGLEVYVAGATKKYLTMLLRGANAKAKTNATQGLPELIGIAKDKAHKENYKEKHNSDAKYGWYKFTSRFALPVYDSDGEIDRYNVFQVIMIVRHAEDGEMYLYDIMNIKKETSNLFQP